MGGGRICLKTLSKDLSNEPNSAGSISLDSTFNAWQEKKRETEPRDTILLQQESNTAAKTQRRIQVTEQINIVKRTQTSLILKD